MPAPLYPGNTRRGNAARNAGMRCSTFAFPHTVFQQTHQSHDNGGGDRYEPRNDESSAPSIPLLSVICKRLRLKRWGKSRPNALWCVRSKLVQYRYAAGAVFVLIHALQVGLSQKPIAYFEAGARGMWFNVHSIIVVLYYKSYSQSQ